MKTKLLVKFRDQNSILLLNFYFLLLLFIIFLEEHKNMLFPNISNRPTHLDDQTQQILTKSTPNSPKNQTHKLSKQTNLQPTQI